MSRLLVTKLWTGDKTERVDFKVDLALVRSHKTRVNLVYRQIHDETDTYAFGINGSWDISQIFSVETQARYLIADPNEWYLSLKLLMNI